MAILRLFHHPLLQVVFLLSKASPTGREADYTSGFCSSGRAGTLPQSVQISCSEAPLQLT